MATVKAIVGKFTRSAQANHGLQLEPSQVRVVASYLAGLNAAFAEQQQVIAGLMEELEAKRSKLWRP